MSEGKAAAGLCRAMMAIMAAARMIASGRMTKINCRASLTRVAKRRVMWMAGSFMVMCLRPGKAKTITAGRNKRSAPVVQSLLRELAGRVRGSKHSFF